MDAPSALTAMVADGLQLESQPGTTLLFRPAGAPAGTWPHMPWWHCVFKDPYERVNFWSHAVPGLMLLLLGLAEWAGSVPGGFALRLFCFCAATTHLLSALTHVWPDDHMLEKLDHLGIVVLIMGTPVTQLLALYPDGDMSGLLKSCVGLVIAAFLRPVPRTIGFLAVGGFMVVQHWYLVDAALFTQCLLYVAGAVCFVRNGGHERLMGLQDHHLLHYKVTLACGLHVINIMVKTALMPAHH